MLPENLADLAKRSRCGLPYVVAQLRANVEVTADNAKQPKILETNARILSGEQSLHQAWLMSTQPHSWKMLPKLCLFEDKHFAGLASAGKRIEQNDYFSPNKVIQIGRAHV